MLDKYKCSCCNAKIAVWYYMPSSDRMKEEDRYYCDDCISSSEDFGCSCNYNHISEIPKGEEDKNWRWVHKNEYWQYLDNKGRPYHCCEYWHDEEGWEIN
jgi:hypothetical protein